MREIFIRLSLTLCLFLYSVIFLPAQILIDGSLNQDIYHEGWIDLNKNKKKDVYEDPSQPIDSRIEDLLSQMTLEEKTCQMATLYGYHRVLADSLPTEAWKRDIIKDGIGNIDEHLNGLAYNDYAQTEYSWPPSQHVRAINQVQRFFIEDTRLGIPVDFTNEGIRGLCHHGATSFPAQIGVGSTWNVELVKQIARITGSEAKALAYSNIYSPIMDIARDPRWGRTVECFGEDPFLVTTFGLEMVNGIQNQGVASTAKHYAVYSAPKGGRDGAVRTDPHITERELHEIYLEPFKAVVEEADILGLMSSYNDYNAIPISGSYYFLTELLRNQWGFKGYVVSDSWAVGGLEGRHYVAENFKESVYLSVMAGLNIRTNFSPPEDFIIPLRELVHEGRIPMEVIDARVKDIVRVKFLLDLFDHPYNLSPDESDLLVHNTINEAVSLQASRESIVLLKNEDRFLPIDRDSIKTILVTGPNADAVNHSISRYGPSHINVVSMYEGIKNMAGRDVRVDFLPGCDFYDENWPQNELYPIPPTAEEQVMIDEAVDKARLADLVIIAVGDNERTVGESFSRSSLDLPGNQKQLIRSIYKVNKNIIVILVNGRPLTINWENDYIPAIIEAWFPGEYGGTAVGEVIFGIYNPGGKLPITFPKTVGQIPFNFPYKKSSQKGQGKESPENIGISRINDALYPFGYGLSYTTFEYSNLSFSHDSLDKDFNVIEISLKVKNSGSVKGDEVVQLYVRDRYSSVVTYEMLLRGFKRITLEPGEERQLEFKLYPVDLQLLDKNMNEVVEPGEFDVFIGSSSEDIRLKGSFYVK